MDNLLPVLYDDLRRLAAWRIASEKPGQTLQATALVHEAFMRLTGSKHPDWRNRSHFMASIAEAMRRILIEQARRKAGPKAGGNKTKHSFEEDRDSMGSGKNDLWLIEVSDAVEVLAKIDLQASELVKMRIFAGLSLEEAADELGVSRSGAYRSWTFARAWLRSALTQQES